MPFQQEPIQNFIGKGITFPIELSNGRAVLKSGTDLIKSSIRMILAWPYNTRFFLPEFGSRIDELLEEPNDTILRNVIRNFVIGAITNWEKRIILVSTEIETVSDTSVNILIRYRVLNSKVEDSLIYPFYRHIKV